MRDHRSKRESPHRDGISLSEDHEVRDRANSLGVGRDELKGAVDKAGNSASKVRAYIAERKHDQRRA